LYCLRAALLYAEREQVEVEEGNGAMNQPTQPPNSDSFEVGKIPDSWIVERRSDGTVRLIQNVNRSGAGCIVFAFAALPTFALIAGVYELFFDIPGLGWGETREKPVTYEIVMAAAFSALTLFWLFWILFGQRELQVAPNFLQDSRVLFGYKRDKQYVNASLEFIYADDEHPPKQGWLVAESQSGRCNIQSFHQDYPDLFEEVSNLGLLLAHTTGWPMKTLIKSET
jgi:hypothetical protein